MLPTLNSSKVKQSAPSSSLLQESSWHSHSLVPSGTEGRLRSSLFLLEWHDISCPPPLVVAGLQTGAFSLRLCRARLLRRAALVPATLCRHLAFAFLPLYWPVFRLRYSSRSGDLQVAILLLTFYLLVSSFPPPLSQLPPSGAHRWSHALAIRFLEWAAHDSTDRRAPPFPFCTSIPAVRQNAFWSRGECAVRIPVPSTGTSPEKRPALLWFLAFRFRTSREGSDHAGKG